MKKVLFAVIAFAATALSTAATSGCAFVILDEPEMPESLR